MIADSWHQDTTRGNEVFIWGHYNVNKGFAILCTSSWFVDWLCEIKDRTKIHEDARLYII